MWWVALVIPALLFAPTLASAEVCDKVIGENWRPEFGPVWLLNPVGFPIEWSILLGGFALVALTKLKWIAYVYSAILLIGTALFVSVDFIPDHEIYRAAVREGCRSYRTDLMNAGLSVVLALAYVLLAHSAKRPPASKQSDHAETT